MGCNGGPGGLSFPYPSPLSIDKLNTREKSFEIFEKVRHTEHAVLSFFISARSVADRVRVGGKDLGECVVLRR